MDYSLDTSGFFNVASRRTALETAAGEIGARLNDTLAAIPTGTYNVTHPVTGGSVSATFSVAANAIRVFAGGRSFAGSQVGEGGWRTNTGLRNFNSASDFQPYAGFVAFDSDGGTTWDFTGTGPGTDFKAVARHELLHVLGIGGASSWDALLSGGTFTGANARAANGGVNPLVTSDGGHFAQTANSIMRPVVSDIETPTAVDYGALDDIGWDVAALPTPGVYADVFGRASDGTWWVSRNANGFLPPEQFGRWNESAGWRDVSKGDFNNDGRTDVVGRTSGGQWWVGLNNGTGFVNSLFGTWSDSAVATLWRDVRVGDFNNDGRDDVAGRTSTGQWWVGLSNGSAFNTTPWAGWTEAIGWRDVSVGDFDNDGRSDIAGRSITGQWWVGLSTGTAFQTRLFGQWTEAAGWRDVRVGDFNADGRSDIIGRSNAGQWWLARSTGSAFTTVPYGAWTESANWRGVLVGDFTGDSRQDIIARTSAGQWWVGTNSGSAFAFTPYGAWTEGAWRDLQAANFAGNGKADVVARTATGQWWVGENTGTRLTFRSFGQWDESLAWRNVAADKNLFSAAAQGAGAQVVTTSSGSGGLLAADSASKPQAAFGPTSGTATLPLTTAKSGTDEDAARVPAASGSGVPAEAEVATVLEATFGDGGLLDTLVAA